MYAKLYEICSVQYLDIKDGSKRPGMRHD